MQKIRFVTAASLFDGHDASINIMRRILQASGVEVIHLGHNRSVREIVNAAVQEDADAIAVSSYQGGHVEYFQYMVDMLAEFGRPDIGVFGGGGGVIIPAEIRALHDYGVRRIFSPEDGRKLGLQGMIDQMIASCRERVLGHTASPSSIKPHAWTQLARLISSLEDQTIAASELQALRTAASNLKNIPVLGVTGTGGSGKSSLTDELVLRFRMDYADDINIAIIAIDPSRRKTGGALLGDRIRMNAIESDPGNNKNNIYMRSLATRESTDEVPPCLHDVIRAIRLSGVDLIIVETPGIGQGDAGIVPYVDTSLYVMTPEFGAGSQLEKIDMLDYADCVAINKFDRRGAEDALHDVRKQLQRNREAFDQSPDAMPVFGTLAAHFNDDGVTALYHALVAELCVHGLKTGAAGLDKVNVTRSSQRSAIVPSGRQRYLAEIAEVVRAYHDKVKQQSGLARKKQQAISVARMLDDTDDIGDISDTAKVSVNALVDKLNAELDKNGRRLLEQWPDMQQRYTADELVSEVRGKEIRSSLIYTSLSGTLIPKICLPGYHDHGDILRWLMLENVPGQFPYTAGVFELKREGEDPTRMFAGEGDAFRTNKRFKYLSEHAQAKRLSTAFDSVTLYGADPATRPDIYGKVGNAGVSIATLDDMKVLYDGFDLCKPTTSVSMTINGPAPTILAMFLNTAIEQKLAAFATEQNRQANEEESAELKALALSQVRGTVQADILKEDQGQNTCLFSTEFSLKVMGDMQEYFIANNVHNFYSVSISGYHIAEAGANPITQLALTLSNGFTYVESYLARGMDVNDFAPNLSFFFSNGMDPEYTVLGRVARRIWAVTMREKYGANERSQKLKYHIQTSGRSLHAQEIDFNDVRTTLQALIAVYDNCNSLHTNAADEAVTTPTENSVRAAVAIQLILNKEWGLAKNENPNQGSFIIEELTDLVEAAVLKEFDSISERGGVLGAMETGYQRGKIQAESMYYEHKKHDGSLPVVGVNTFLKDGPEEEKEMELARSTEAEKQNQIARLHAFKCSNKEAYVGAINRLKQVAVSGGNVFAELMNTVRYCSLGDITDALFQVGGKYRRNM